MELKRLRYGISNCINNSLSKKNIYFIKRPKKFIFLYFSIWRHASSWIVLKIFLPLGLGHPLVIFLNISSFNNIWVKDRKAIFSKYRHSLFYCALLYRASQTALLYKLKARLSPPKRLTHWRLRWWLPFLAIKNI